MRKRGFARQLCAWLLGASEVPQKLRFKVSSAPLGPALRETSDAGEEEPVPKTYHRSAPVMAATPVMPHTAAEVLLTLAWFSQRPRLPRSLQPLPTSMMMSVVISATPTLPRMI